MRNAYVATLVDGSVRVGEYPLLARDGDSITVRYGGKDVAYSLTRDRFALDRDGAVRRLLLRCEVEFTQARDMAMRYRERREQVRAYLDRLGTEEEEFQLCSS
jgi:hypothetical protein